VPRKLKTTGNLSRGEFTAALGRDQAVALVALLVPGEAGVHRASREMLEDRPRR
jgi:hypothetical protein